MHGAGVSRNPLTLLPLHPTESAPIRSRSVHYCKPIGEYLAVHESLCVYANAGSEKSNKRKECGVHLLVSGNWKYEEKIETCTRSFGWTFCYFRGVQIHAILALAVRWQPAPARVRNTDSAPITRTILGPRGKSVSSTRQPASTRDARVMRDGRVSTTHHHHRCRLPGLSRHG